LFLKQPQEYQNTVLNLPHEKRISVEMLSTFGWDKFSKHHMGIDTFGASAPAKDVIKKFDFNSDALVALAKNCFIK
jgi:transketolase